MEIYWYFNVLCKLWPPGLFEDMQVYVVANASSLRASSLPFLFSEDSELNLILR